MTPAFPLGSATPAFPLGFVTPAFPLGSATPASPLGSVIQAFPLDSVINCSVKIQTEITQPTYAQIPNHTKFSSYQNISETK